MRLLAACLVLALVLPGALAQQEDRVRAASILVYHPWPDPRAGAPDADPLGSPLAPPPDGLRIGSTLFDGTALASGAPEGTPESALAHFREFQRLLLQRERTGAPLALTLGGRVEADTLRIEATVSQSDLPLSLSFVLFENGVPAQTSEGLRAQPYVARVVLPAEPVDASAGPATVVREAALDPAWDLQRLGVVAIARAAEAGERHAQGEVVQSAAWLVRSPAPTTQTDKAVLVERASATWCDPCRPGDEALTLLASQYGVDAPASTTPDGYLRAPSAFAFAGLLAGLGVGLVLLRRRDA